MGFVFLLLFRSRETDIRALWVPLKAGWLPQGLRGLAQEPGSAGWGGAHSEKVVLPLCFLARGPPPA